VLKNVYTCMFFYCKISYVAKPVLGKVTIKSNAFQCCVTS